jgi:flagellar motility protein MotE (MotC chaperone)
MKFLQSTFFASVLGSVIFLGTSAALTIKGVASAMADAPPENSGPVADTKGPSWSFFNPELDQIVADLRTEREAIAIKEKKLEELASRIRAERAELDEKLRSVGQLQQQVDRNVIQIKADEAGNLKRLSKMYAAMEPPGAARILREVEDSVVVKVMTLMKEPETAQILEALARMGDAETKRAAGIAETLRVAISAKASAKP